jgi:holo-[acyl-carrier protein] synthase
VTALPAGCDLVDIARLSAAIDRRPALLARVFTARELADARRDGVAEGSEVERARLAARFAAKEAARKALGDLRLPFHAVEVRTTDDGAPLLYLHGEPAPLACSLSHDGGMAMAVVVGLAADAPAATDAAATDAAATDAAATDAARTTDVEGPPPRRVPPPTQIRA